MLTIRFDRLGVSPGDLVLAGTGAGDSTDDRMVMVVADMSTLTVRTRVLEADLRYVKVDLPVKVKLDAYPDVNYDGVVQHIGGQGRTDNKAGYTYFDRAGLPNYWAYADRFVLADRFFTSMYGPTLPEHLYALVARAAESVEHCGALVLRQVQGPELRLRGLRQIAARQHFIEMRRVAAAGMPDDLLRPLSVRELGGSTAAAPVSTETLVPALIASILVLLAVLTMTGAFYPAIDAIAGEKERGTVETLLMAPCSTGSIVFGKFLAVCALAFFTGASQFTQPTGAIAAAAVGLVMSVLMQVGAKALTTHTDYVFAGLTAAAVFFFHVPVLYALLAFGVIAIWWNRPRDKPGEKAGDKPTGKAGGKDGAP